MKEGCQLGQSRIWTLCSVSRAAQFRTGNVQNFWPLISASDKFCGARNTTWRRYNLSVGWGSWDTWFARLQKKTTTMSFAAALWLPTDWSRPRTTWLRTIDEDVQPQNFGVYMVWRKARGQDYRIGKRPVLTSVLLIQWIQVLFR